MMKLILQTFKVSTATVFVIFFDFLRKYLIEWYCMVTKLIFTIQFDFLGFKQPKEKKQLLILMRFKLNRKQI